jgi:hypothetical protein
MLFVRSCISGSKCVLYSSADAGKLGLDVVDPYMAVMVTGP